MRLQNASDGRQIQGAAVPDVGVFIIHHWQPNPSQPADESLVRQPAADSYLSSPVVQSTKRSPTRRGGKLGGAPRVAAADQRFHVTAAKTLRLGIVENHDDDDDDE